MRTDGPVLGSAPGEGSGLRAKSAASSVVVGLLLGILGCGGTDNGFAAVTGMVTLDGVPLPRGTVTLRPVGGNPTAHHPTGVIASDGRYTIYTAGQAGAPVGRYRVLVFANEELERANNVHPAMPRSMVPDRYRNADSTPLAIDVVASPAAGAYDIELESDPTR